MNFGDSGDFADLWKYLKSSKKHKVLYGMGNGADKVLAVCKDYGIEIDDFFASDDFVRGHSFHGKRVLSYSEIIEKYEASNTIVLLCFATRLDSVLSNIYKIASECELYAPDVPVYGNEIFNAEYLSSHIEQIKAAARLFSDEKSRSTYTDIINYKLSGKTDYLISCESTENETFSLLGADKFIRTADLGAYNGDSIRQLLKYSPNLSHVTALEPDRRNFRKLCEYRDSKTDSIIIDAYNCGAWSEKNDFTFEQSGNRNASFASNISYFQSSVNSENHNQPKHAKQAKTEVNTLDNILGGERVDYIKYDVEGSEKEALEGSLNTIKKYSPALLVSAYHRSCDIFTLPTYVHQINPDYSMYLRKLRYIPAWDINLLAVKQ